jgi:hypothetical protein
MAEQTRAPSAAAEPSGFTTFFGNAGASFLEIAETAGGMTMLLVRVLVRLVPPRVDSRELLKNLYKMGVKSLPIVAVTALFTGAIMVIQAAAIVKRYGAEGLLGWGAGFGTLREIAPLLTALMISGRVGANNTAELGTMVVTEQLDALRVLAIDPIEFLIAPRFISIVSTLFMMTLFADALALFGAGIHRAGPARCQPHHVLQRADGGPPRLRRRRHGPREERRVRLGHRARELPLRPGDEGRRSGGRPRRQLHGHGECRRRLRRRLPDELRARRLSVHESLPRRE